jgi:hypothetical protein
MIKELVLSLSCACGAIICVSQLTQDHFKIQYEFAAL